MNIKNQEHYMDKTAYSAIREADKTPDSIGKMMRIFREIASLNGFDISNRIHFKDKNTGREWR